VEGLGGRGEQVGREGSVKQHSILHACGTSWLEGVIHTVLRYIAGEMRLQGQVLEVFVVMWKKAH
jgi:hypothetical protein